MSLAALMQDHRSHVAAVVALELELRVDGFEKESIGRLGKDRDRPLPGGL